MFVCVYAHTHASIHTHTDTQCQRAVWCCRECSLEELESRHSDLRRELVAAKEAVSQVTLQKEVLEDEKSSLAAALSKVPLLSPTLGGVQCCEGLAAV